MTLSKYKQKIVYQKTNNVCAICGCTHELTAVCFIPEWTRIVQGEIDNMIPLCDECREKRGLNFIELGRLRYLPELYIQQLMRYYQSIYKYLYKYVKMYAEYRTNNLVSSDECITIMASYNHYCKLHEDELNWEEDNKT